MIILIFNIYILKTTKERNVIDPYAVIKHESDFIGIKVRYVNNKFGTTFYHAPEKNIGRYKQLSIINIPYDIVDVNKSIMKQSNHIIHKDIDKFSYKNNIYQLFISEFSYIIRKDRNNKLREQIKNVLKTGTLNRDRLKDLLKNYNNDYNTLVELISNNIIQRVITLFDTMSFEFDNLKLPNLREMNLEKRYNEIDKIMKPNVIFSDKGRFENYIILFKIDIKQKYCDKQKLLIEKDYYIKCCKLLAKDLDSIYLYELITTNLSTVKKILQFVKRDSEKLEIEIIN